MPLPFIAAVAEISMEYNNEYMLEREDVSVGGARIHNVIILNIKVQYNILI